MIGTGLLLGCAGRGKETLAPRVQARRVESAPSPGEPRAPGPAPAEPIPAGTTSDRMPPAKPSAGSVTPTEPGQRYDLAPIPAHITEPEYPEEARRRGLHGTVVVEFLIDASGRVSRARVVQSIPELDGAALDCVRTWRFKPALRGGKPIATTARAPLRF